jgi:predicted glycoside hydrolase/deacetylase ChbG (UPF0249 family)
MPTSKWLLSRLGFSNTDRVVVLHADDIGMCESSVSAFRQISDRGILSSAAGMVPCGWFPALAAACRDSPGADVGVHLTLNSEWDNYRWGPLLGPRASDLCDEAGYFFRKSEDVQRDSARNAAYRELRTQILRAMQMGIDVTHLDSHMFTLMHPSLFAVYSTLSREFRVPCVVLPSLAEGLMPQLEPEEREELLVFDGWAQLPLNDHAERLECARRLLHALPEGLCYLISHPAIDTPELRAIAPDWRARVADYELYLDDDWARILDEAGVKVVGMRAIRNALFERA